MSTTKTPAAPMNGRWLKSGELIRRGDYIRRVDGSIAPAFDAGKSFESPWPYANGQYCGFFRPGKPARKKPKRKVKTLWIYHVTLHYGAGQIRAHETREKARYARSTFECQHSKCGPIVKIEVPVA